MTRYAVVTTVDIPAVIYAEGISTPDFPANTVINIIEIDNLDNWQAPANTVMAPSDTLNVGDTNM